MVWRTLGGGGEGFLKHIPVFPLFIFLGLLYIFSLFSSVFPLMSVTWGSALGVLHLKAVPTLPETLFPRSVIWRSISEGLGCSGTL